MRPFQSTKQLWACAPISINQATLSTRAPWFTRHGLGPPSSTCLNSWLHPPPPHQGQMDPHTPSPLFEHGILWCSLMASIWWYHRRSEGSQDHNGRYFSSWIDLTVKKSAYKSSAVSAQEGGILYWHPCWIAYKRNMGGPGLQSAASDWHCHTLCGKNLNYTTWILYAESVSWARPDQQGRAQPYQSGKLERAPLKWARPFLLIRQTWAPPSQVSASLSINQANLSAPIQKGALFPILQTVSQELRMNGGMAKPEPTCRNWTRTHTLQ